jgi:hypothetical protein
LPKARLTIVVLTLCACLPATAIAATAKMSAAFIPERLGAPTTVSFGFRINDTDGTPALLRGVDVSFPADLGFATSGLGVASCSPEALQEDGAAACPANSIMGSGSAVVEIPIGPVVLRETASLALVAGPSADGYLHILIAATGRTPVAARVVLSTVLLPGRLHIDVPPIPSLPEGPDVAVVRLSAVIGGDLRYLENVGGRTIVYRPAGIRLPNTCPRGGFRFGARFRFVSPGAATGHATVPCPRRR